MRRRFSFEFKITGILLVILALVAITGLYAYKRFSDIIINITDTARPDTRLIAAQELVNTLNVAELSAKSFSITRDSVYLNSFLSAVQNIDKNLLDLRNLNENNKILLVQVDSLDTLVCYKLQILNDLILLRDKYRVQMALDNVIQRIKPDITDSSQAEYAAQKRDLFSRLFNRQKIRSNDTTDPALMTVPLTEISDQVDLVKGEEILIERKIKTKELELIVRDQKINTRLSEILDEMKSNERLIIESETQKAQLAIDQTNRQIAWFCVATGILIVFMAFIIVNYVRNNTKYRIALHKARLEAQDLADTKQLFLANMSHEIRTPLNAIIGFTEQITKSSLSQTQREQVSIIRKSADHLLYLVNSVLDITKLQADKITLESIAFSPSEIIRETIDLVKSQELKTGVSISHEISGEIPEVVTGDPFRLRQILINLISNSLKFTQKGSIDISLSSELLPGNLVMLKFTVSDTGIGMTKTEMEKAFKEFEQANTSTSRNFGGTGLGLSIVKRLIALQKGKLDMKSTPGEGTTVIFELPYKIANVRDLKRRENELLIDPAGILNKVSILIVDDEDYNRTLLKTILQNCGSALREAKNGKEALEQLNNTRFDLILMDVRMPDLSGTEVTTILRQNKKNINTDTPVIALTAAVTEQDRMNYILAGMNGFLAKPIKERLLLTEIIRVLYGKEDLEGIELVQQPEQKIPDNNTVIRLTELEQISGGDIVFYTDMLQLFLDGTSKGLIEIRDSYTISDWNSVAEQAHKISSPCKHVGALMLYQQLKTIENRCRKNEDLDTIDELICDAEKQGKLVCSAITKELESVRKRVFQ